MSSLRPKKASYGLVRSVLDAVGWKLIDLTQKSAANWSIRRGMVYGSACSCARTRPLMVWIMRSATGTCCPGPAMFTSMPSALRVSASADSPPSPSARSSTQPKPRLFAIASMACSAARSVSVSRFLTKLHMVSPSGWSTATRNARPFTKKRSAWITWGD